MDFVPPGLRVLAAAFVYNVSFLYLCLFFTRRLCFSRTLRLLQRMGIGTQAKACHFG